jgi:hypothetical protein
MVLLGLITHIFLVINFVQSSILPEEIPKTILFHINVIQSLFRSMITIDDDGK